MTVLSYASKHLKSAWRIETAEQTAAQQAEQLRNISNPLGGLKPKDKQLLKQLLKAASKHLKSAWRIETHVVLVGVQIRRLRNISNPLGGLKLDRRSGRARVRRPSKHLKSAWRIETLHAHRHVGGATDLRNISNPLGGLKHETHGNLVAILNTSKHLKSAWRIETRSWRCCCAFRSFETSQIRLAD